MTGYSQGVDLAVWLIGLVLGMASVIGPLTAILWALATLWRSIGITHRARAIRAHWRNR